MFDRVRAAAAEMEAALAELEPESMVGGLPARALELVGTHERVVAATRLRLTARAADMNHWQRLGYHSFEDWFAATFGTTQGQARRKTRTARNLNNGADRTADALADGSISEDQADVIADAADKNPEAEQELLDTAKNKGRDHDDLRKKAADAKAAKEDDKARAARLRRGRRAGWGVDRDGFWTLSGRFEPHVGAEMKTLLAEEAERIFVANRRAGTREPRDRYRADALTNLVLGRHRTPPSSGDTGAAGGRAPGGDDHAAPDEPGGEPHPTPASPASGGSGCDSCGQPATRVTRELVLDINLSAIRRGHLESGERCNIRGVGPVPVEIARQWAEDAFIKAVIRDGDDIKMVAHFGRHIPATLRTALGIRETTCAVPGCSNPRIEYDHDQTVADHGVCSSDNLRPLCVAHHRQRTHDGFELRGPPGERVWTGPDGNVLFGDDFGAVDAQLTL